MTTRRRRVVAPGELAASLGVERDFLAGCLPGAEFPTLAYRRLDPSERDAVLLRILRELERSDLPRAGVDDASRWDRGWGEILAAVKAQGLSDALLRPQYFRHNELRLLGDYAHVDDPQFEYEFYLAARKVLFRKYLAGLDGVIEFGCGTGTSLVLLAKIFSHLALIGCDWARPSQELMAIIAQETRSNLRGHWFNMLTLEGASDLPKSPNCGIITMHSMEQLGENFDRFLDFLIGSDPRICLHVEPIVELYDESMLFDNLAIRYHKKRNYLSGFLQALRRLADARRIEIIEQRRLGLGSLFHEGYSVIVWRPL